jgi:hypothetical protein
VALRRSIGRTVGLVLFAAGVAYTIGLGPTRGEDALFLYLSLEHSFRRANP